jgi:hypothetical protein
MRMSTLADYIVVPLFVLTLSCGMAAPAFASGDGDKPAAAPSSAKARPDRETKVYTNDDLDRMFPKAQPVAASSQTSQPGAASTLPQQRSAVRTAFVPVPPEKNPVWYATQFTSLSAELNAVAGKEESLREFRANGASADVTVGLQIYAPCEGISTDNQISQLAMQRNEIAQRIEDLQTTARQNNMPAAIFQDSSAIIESAQKPLSPGQQEAALRIRQAELVGQLNGVQNELADMSDQAAQLGANLLPPAPNSGGNMTTNLQQNLDSRATQLKSDLSANEDAAHRAGIAPSTLP